MSKLKQLSDNLSETNTQIDQALDASLRSRAGLTMVAVSKRHPLATVKDAYGLGLRHFGENQIQEAVPKVRASPDDIKWHFIGHLQKNKVRKVVKYFQYLHSVDSMSLITRIDAIASEERVCPSVFLQVNYAQDADKHGLHPEEVEPVLTAALNCKNVRCIGLMAMPPRNSDQQANKSYFQGIREMRDHLISIHPQWSGQLSLGMSGDFELAISEDSNYIRVGTCLFGERL